MGTGIFFVIVCNRLH